MHLRSCWQDVLQRLDTLSTHTNSSSSSSDAAVLSTINRADTSCACWTRADYHAKYGGRATSPQYLEDSNGDFLGKDWVVGMGNDARRFWKRLASTGRAPATWGKIDADAWAEFTAYMYARHPELRLCDSDWKVHFWCTNHYSDWHKHNVGPNSVGVKRSDSPYSNDEDEDVSPPAKRAKIG
jgi:hypothetical protein